jgi:hypothetical protein
MTGKDGEHALLSQMADLVALEHSILRTLGEQHSGDRISLRAELRRVEAELDQCWDLLRQRRALRAAHLDANNASVRPVEQVENYLPHPGGPF